MTFSTNRFISMSFRTKKHKIHSMFSKNDADVTNNACFGRFCVKLRWIPWKCNETQQIVTNSLEITKKDNVFYHFTRNLDKIHRFGWFRNKHLQKQSRNTKSKQKRFESLKCLTKIRKFQNSWTLFQTVAKQPLNSRWTVAGQSLDSRLTIVLQSPTNSEADFTISPRISWLQPEFRESLQNSNYFKSVYTKTCPFH